MACTMQTFAVEVLMTTTLVCFVPQDSAQLPGQDHHVANMVGTPVSVAF